jgi:hypothetical protein
MSLLAPTTSAVLVTRHAYPPEPQTEHVIVPTPLYC